MKVTYKIAYRKLIEKFLHLQRSLSIRGRLTDEDLHYKNILKQSKESDTYLTHVCRHRWSRQITENKNILFGMLTLLIMVILMKVEKFTELSASTVAFISYRGRLTKVLAGALGGKREVRVSGTTRPPPP